MEQLRARHFQASPSTVASVTSGSQAQSSSTGGHATAGRRAQLAADTSRSYAAHLVVLSAGKGRCMSPLGSSVTTGPDTSGMSPGRQHELTPTVDTNKPDLLTRIQTSRSSETSSATMPDTLAVPFQATDQSSCPYATHSRQATVLPGPAGVLP